VIKSGVVLSSCNDRKSGCCAHVHNLKLFKCSLDVQKYSFAYRVIDIWNSLSSDIVNACSISVQYLNTN